MFRPLWCLVIRMVAVLILSPHNLLGHMVLVCIISVICIPTYAILRWNILVHSTMSHCILTITNHRMLIQAEEVYKFWI